METAEEAVGLRAGPGAKTSIEDIQSKTAEFYKLDVKDFHSPQRARRVARPRQVAMYLSRKLTTRSLPEIGRRFGGRDHTTVLHACRRIEALIVEDPLFRQEVDFLTQMLQRRGEPEKAWSIRASVFGSAVQARRKRRFLASVLLRFRSPFAWYGSALESWGRSRLSETQENRGLSGLLERRRKWGLISSRIQASRR